MSDLSGIPQHLNPRQQLEFVTNELIAARADHDRLTAELSTMARSDGDLTAGQKQRWDDTSVAIEKVSARLTTLANQRDWLLADRADQARRLAGGPGVTFETGDGAEAAGRYRDVHYSRNPGDIYDRSGLHVDDENDGPTYRDRALRAIDGWPRTIPAEYRASAERLVENADGSARDRAVADHLLAAGHPDYVAGFRSWLRNPTAGIGPLPEAQRAAMAEGTTTTGGFMLPVYIDPTIILTNSGVVNPIRGISKVLSITTQTWRGVTSAGVTAEWTAEAAEMTDASPTVAQPTITPVRADAVVQLSWEMLEDTSIGTELAGLFADAKDRLEGAAFAVGTGSTQPTGIVTALNLVTASRVDATTNGALGAIDIFALDNSLSPRWRGNASWVASKAYLNRIRQLGTTLGYSFWTDFGGGMPATLIGYPVYGNSSMTSTLSAATASSDACIVLGDFRAGFYVVDRVGMSVVHNPVVIGPNRRPTGEGQFVAYWRVGSGCPVPDAFRMLIL